MKYFVLLAGVLFLAGALSAQTNGLVISSSTEAVAIHYNNQWGAGNVTSLLVDVYDWGPQKGNSLSAAAYTLISAPAPGFSSYLAGVRYTPDISNLVKHTNIASDQFGVFAEGAIGNSVISGSGSKITFFVGGGAHFRVTPAVSWSAVDFRVGRVGSTPYYEASSGLVYYFNPQAAKSFAVKRMLVRARARRLAAGGM